MIDKNVLHGVGKRNQHQGAPGGLEWFVILWAFISWALYQVLLY